MYPKREFNPGGNRQPARPGFAGRRPAGGRPFGGRPFGGRSGGGARGRGMQEMSRFELEAIIDASNRVVPQTEEAIVAVDIKNQFSDFPLPEFVQRNLTKAGYQTPTPIQDQVIPLVIAEKDVVGIANTGTGKSAAFLLPLLKKVSQNQNQRALVVVPTRELATQLVDEFRKFSLGTSFRAVTCVGGLNIRTQISNLSRQHQFVIGTPGRLKDLIQRNTLHLQHYNTVVLDEVDRMLDMGFIADVSFLIAKLPAKRQSLFFSATMTPKVEEVLKQFVQDYVKVSVKTKETSGNITQRMLEVSSAEGKFRALTELLQVEETSKALIFVRTKFGADRIAKQLSDAGIRSDAIHGNKSQSQRQRVLDAFKAGQLKTLVATDVAARGLDIPHVSHVINYDLPGTAADYVHRIGRTGRAGNTGIAISFVVGH